MSDPSWTSSSGAGRSAGNASGLHSRTGIGASSRSAPSSIGSEHMLTVSLPSQPGTRYSGKRISDFAPERVGDRVRVPGIGHPPVVPVVAHGELVLQPVDRGPRPPQLPARAGPTELARCPADRVGRNRAPAGPRPRRCDPPVRTGTPSPQHDGAGGAGGGAPPHRTRESGWPTSFGRRSVARVPPAGRVGHTEAVVSVARMRRPTGLLAALILLAGCARGGHAGGSAPGNAGADQPSVRDFIAAWDEAIGQRNGPAFIVTSPLQDQVGTWSMAEGAHNKEAVLSGRVVAGPGVIAARAPATGTVRPSGQPPKKVPVITAAQAVRAIAAAGSPSGPCDQGCAPLALAHARLVTSRVSTTAGPLDVPTWSFEVPGSKVRITRVAIDTTALIVPPAIAGGPAAVGAQTETAVLSGPTGVTVTFAGASTSDPPVRSDLHRHRGRVEARGGRRHRRHRSR